MEFRLYNKYNCSFFDLIGRLEPHQTKSLGVLLAKSQVAFNSFLKLIHLKIDYDKYVIDCEPRDIQNKRFDILIRFYKECVPQKAIIVEAKSIIVSNMSKRAINQVQNYSQSDYFLDFPEPILVTLTRDVKLSTNNVISITWSQLISALNNVKDEMTLDYINYLIRMQGSMNYYDKEIQAIPAGKSLDAINACGLYECPTTGKRYANQRKILYLAFKDKRGGSMTMLYKVKEIVEGINLNDLSQLKLLKNMPEYSNIESRILQYKEITKYNSNDTDSKRLFILDMDNSIKLLYPVRPLENNSNWPYYSLKDFIQPANSDINCVILQTILQIEGNILKINLDKSRKKIEICKERGSKQIFTQSNSCPLDPHSIYTIDILGVKRGGKICEAKLENVNNTWKIQFIFNFSRRKK